MAVTNETAGGAGGLDPLVLATVAIAEATAGLIIATVVLGRHTKNLYRATKRSRLKLRRVVPLIPLTILALVLVLGTTLGARASLATDAINSAPVGTFQTCRCREASTVNLRTPAR